MIDFSRFALAPLVLVSLHLGMHAARADCRQNLEECLKNRGDRVESDPYIVTTADEAAQAMNCPKGAHREIIELPCRKEWKYPIYNKETGKFSGGGEVMVCPEVKYEFGFVCD